MEPSQDRSPRVLCLLLSYSLTQLHLPGYSVRSQWLRARPTTAPTPLLMPIVGIGPRLLTTSVQLEGKSVVPMISASRSINLLEQLPELRETLMFTSLLKDMITDTDEEPDEGCVG